jgi:hypothetical protein
VIKFTLPWSQVSVKWAIQEEIMALSEAYLAWETELKETSREEGLQEGEWGCDRAWALVMWLVAIDHRLKNTRLI